MKKSMATVTELHPCVAQLTKTVSPMYFAHSTLHKTVRGIINDLLTHSVRFGGHNKDRPIDPRQDTTAMTRNGSTLEKIVRFILMYKY